MWTIVEDEDPPHAPASSRVLRPLSPPQTFLTPYAWVFKEPTERAAQRHREATRCAQNYLRRLYRHVTQNKFRDVFVESIPWLQSLMSTDDGPSEQGPSLPRKKYLNLPCPLVIWEGASPPKRQQFSTQDVWSKNSKHDDSVRKQRYEAAVLKKKETLQVMRRFSASNCGAPCYLKQVYEEFDASSRFQKAHDTRPISGSLGPLDLGRGTTPLRRPYPFPFLAQGDAARSAQKGIAKGSAAGSSARRSGSLPALKP